MVIKKLAKTNIDQVNLGIILAETLNIKVKNIRMINEKPESIANISPKKELPCSFANKIEKIIVIGRKKKPILTHFPSGKKICFKKIVLKK